MAEPLQGQLVVVLLVQAQVVAAVAAVLGHLSAA